MVKDCEDEQCHHAAQYATAIAAYGIRFTALQVVSTQGSWQAANDAWLHEGRRWICARMS